MTDVEAGYRGDLAHVQDAGFGDFARGAAPGLLLALAEEGIRDGVVVDLGCGSGIWAEILLAAGYDVHGIELSADLLEIARRRAPGARFAQGALLDAGLPPCVAVTAIGEVLGYAFDPRTGAEAMSALFERIHAALTPGGLLLFDVAVAGRASRRPRPTWREGEGWLLCVEAFEDRVARRLTRRITLFRRDEEGAWRRSDEVHTLHLHDPDELTAALVRAGFEAQVLGGWGRMRLGRGHIAVHARRPV
jgi:SAM-dependent methyltransferase